MDLMSGPPNYRVKQLKGVLRYANDHLGLRTLICLVRMPNSRTYTSHEISDRISSVVNYGKESPFKPTNKSESEFYFSNSDS